MRWLATITVLGVLATAAAFVSTAGAAPPAGYVIVHSALASAPSGTQTHGVVVCPTGKVVLGGGVDVQSSSFDANVNGTYPEGTTEWGADVNNASGAAISFRVWAVCGKQNAAYKVVESPFAIDVPPHGDTPFSISCPIGTKVLGGGAATNSGSTDVNLNSSYPTHKKLGTSTQFTWKVNVNNATASDWFVTPVAVCGTSRGYTFVTGPKVNMIAGGRTTAHVNCPSPTLPLSGGLLAHSADLSVNLNGSFPSTTAWRVAENDALALFATFTPYAVCAGT
jgi:hypothetical protein